MFLCKEMARHLEHDYELEEKPSGWIPHLHDTLEVLGGLKGLFILCLAIAAFYGIVVYFVTTGRSKRESKKRN